MVEAAVRAALAVRGACGVGAATVVGARAVRALLLMQSWRRFFCQKGCPQWDVRVNYVVRHSTNYRLIAAIERPEAVIDGKWISAQMNG